MIFKVHIHTYVYLCVRLLYIYRSGLTREGENHLVRRTTGGIPEDVSPTGKLHDSIDWKLTLVLNLSLQANFTMIVAN